MCPFSDITGSAEMHAYSRLFHCPYSISDFIHINGVTLILHRNLFSGGDSSFRFRKLSFSYSTGYMLSVLTVGLILLLLKAKAKFSVSGLNCMLC